MNFELQVEWLLVARSLDTSSKFPASCQTLALSLYFPYFKSGLSYSRVVSRLERLILICLMIRRTKLKNSSKFWPRKRRRRPPVEYWRHPLRPRNRLPAITKEICLVELQLLVNFIQSYALFSVFSPARTSFDECSPIFTTFNPSPSDGLQLYRYYFTRMLILERVFNVRCRFF